MAISIAEEPAAYAEHIIIRYDRDIETMWFDVEGKVFTFYFQHGPIPEKGSNGVTNEAVITGLVMRLNALNKDFPCRENSLAITKLEEALHWLNARTERRRREGIEGQNVESEGA